MFLKNTLVFTVAFDAAILASYRSSSGGCRRIRSPLEDRATCCVTNAVASTGNPLTKTAMGDNRCSTAASTGNMCSLAIGGANVCALAMATRKRSSCRTATRFASKATGRDLVIMGMGVSAAVRFNRVRRTSKDAVRTPGVRGPRGRGTTAVGVPAKNARRGAGVTTIIFRRTHRTGPTASARPRTSGTSMGGMTVGARPTSTITGRSVVVTVPGPSASTGLNCFSPRGVRIRSDRTPTAETTTGAMKFGGGGCVVAVPRNRGVTNGCSPEIGFAGRTTTDMTSNCGRIGKGTRMVGVRGESCSTLRGVVLALGVGGK